MNACKNSRYDTGDEDMYIVIATYGAIAEFFSSQQTWTIYIECPEQYLMANKIEDANEQRAVLLHVCGLATYRLIRNLVSPKKPVQLKFAEIIEIVNELKPSLIVKRFHFYERSCQDGESISTRSYSRTLTADNTVSMVIP